MKRGCAICLDSGVIWEGVRHSFDPYSMDRVPERFEFCDCPVGKMWVNLIGEELT